MLIPPASARDLFIHSKLQRGKKKKKKEFEMGSRNRDLLTVNQNSTSTGRRSVSEGLIFATLCLIGLQVDVHISNGYIYSGTFYTASIDSDYGVVLKNAKMTKKGKGKTNVSEESLVKTLVILSRDIVQVVTKSDMRPGEGVDGNVTGDDKVACQVENHTELLMDAEQVNQSRQIGDDNSKRKDDNCRQKSKFDEQKNDENIQSLESNRESLDEVAGVEHGSSYTRSSSSDNRLLYNNAPASAKVDDQGSERSTSADSTSTNSSEAVDLKIEAHKLPENSVKVSAPRGTDCTRNAKDFKLNPAAEIFSPSFVNSNSASAMPTTANMVYIPNSSLAASITTIQPEVGFNTFASRPSVAVKVAQYNNLTVGNTGSGSQFSQPIVGQLAHRTQPLRYAAHYTPVLSEPAYMQPSSPAVIVGRSSPLVYVHPVSHDMGHGTNAVSPFLARPLLNHVQFPKQQGGSVGQAMPVCMPQPVLTTVQQSYPLQSHIPVLQSGFSTSRPISVPGPNGFYGAKFS